MKLKIIIEQIYLKNNVKELMVLELTKTMVQIE